MAFEIAIAAIPANAALARASQHAAPNSTTTITSEQLAEHARLLLVELGGVLGQVARILVRLRSNSLTKTLDRRVLRLRLLLHVLTELCPLLR